MVPNPCRAFVAVTGALVFASGACARTVYQCPPAEPSPNLDSLMNGFGGPPRLRADSSVPTDSIRGVVLEAVGRRPVKNAEIRYRSDTSHHTLTDSSGVFSLPLLPMGRTVLEVRALGFAGRRDTIEFSRLRSDRIELTLLDAWARGDIQGVPVCTPAKRGGLR
jgi:hypothetical protein